MSDIPADELSAVFGAAAVTDVEPLRPRSLGATVGVWRIRSGRRSAVLKLLRVDASPNPNWRSSPDPEHPRFWRRELEALRSGAVAALPPDLRAPELLHAADRPDGSLALWLEDLGAPERWTIQDLARVAERLGRVQSRVRDDLTRGFLRVYLEPRAAHLADPFRARRDELLERLDAKPHALAHFDFHPGNLFRGGDDFAVIDWAYCGSGPIGADAGVLAADAVFAGDYPLDEVETLIGRVWEAFSSGLDSDLLADAHEVYALATALRYAWVGAWVAGRFGPAPAPERARAVLRGRDVFAALAQPYL